MKQEINVFDYSGNILSSLKDGILLTTKNDGKVDSMTIGWGTLGIEWGEAIFIAYIREGRFTREQLDKTKEFTLNIPYGEYDKKIIGYCGSHSGRNTDKAKNLNLTLVESDEVEAPGIKQLPLTLECKVIYRRLQDKNLIPDEIRNKMYPEDVDSSKSGANRDYHVAYYGKIVKAYIIK